MSGRKTDKTKKPRPSQTKPNAKKKPISISNPNTNPNSKNKKKAVYKEQLKALGVFNLFMTYYRKQWGDRWPKLLSAMEGPNDYCILVNLFASPSSLSLVLTLPSLVPLQYISTPCIYRRITDYQNLPFPPPFEDDSHISNYYPLDVASVLVTEALDIKPEDRILDLCAAPGGKSLSIIQKFFFPQAKSWKELPNENFSEHLLEFLEKNGGTQTQNPFGSLTLNDISLSRLNRLKKIINSYVPKDYRKQITITQKDATNSGAFPASNFTKILIDAPCSSERHLLRNSVTDESDKKNSSDDDDFGSDSEDFGEAQNQSKNTPLRKEGKKLVDEKLSEKKEDEKQKFNLENYSPEFLNWGQSRSRNNSIRQIALLKNCFNFLVEGGIIVYATCSISKLENDGVVQRVIKKSNFEIFCEKKDWQIGEPTKYGWIVLPDKESGWGPLYFAVLRKGEEKEDKKRTKDEDEEEDEEEEEINSYE